MELLGAKTRADAKNKGAKTSDDLIKQLNTLTDDARTAITSYTTLDKEGNRKLGEAGLLDVLNNVKKKAKDFAIEDATTVPAIENQVLTTVASSDQKLPDELATHKVFKDNPEKWKEVKAMNLTKLVHEKKLGGFMGFGKSNPNDQQLADAYAKWVTEKKKKNNIDSQVEYLNAVYDDALDAAYMPQV
jgi:hypothetical protein